MAGKVEAPIRETDVDAYREFVREAREDPAMIELVRKNFLDSDLRVAAERFAQSPEYRAALSKLEPRRGGRILEIGAGRGILSFCLAKRGFHVTAIDLNIDPEIGVGARGIYRSFSPVAFQAVVGDCERLPFRESSFHYVVGRAVLHHASSLDAMVKEAARVLKPGGCILTLAEHTIPIYGGRKKFIRRHRATRYGVRENAYRYLRYSRAFGKAGFSAFDLFPSMSFREYRQKVRQEWGRHRSLLRRVASQLERIPVVGTILLRCVYHLSRFSEHHFGWPGKPTAFVAEKPGRV